MLKNKKVLKMYKNATEVEKNILNYLQNFQASEMNTTFIVVKHTKKYLSLFHWQKRLPCPAEGWWISKLNKISTTQHRSSMSLYILKLQQNTRIYILEKIYKNYILLQTIITTFFQAESRMYFGIKRKIVILAIEFQSNSLKRLQSLEAASYKLWRSKGRIQKFKT